MGALAMAIPLVADSSSSVSRWDSLFPSGIKKEYCRVSINDEGNLTIAIENKAEPKQKVTKAIEAS